MSHNFFEIFSLEPSFEIDLAALEKAYFKAQQDTHPDRMATKSPEERQLAMQRSADANLAYQTLKNPLKRAQYLLKLEEILVGTDKDSIKPPQELLIEIMEWREKMEEASDTDSLQAELKGLYDASLATIPDQYKNKEFQAMAEETLRLGYFSKMLDELKRHIL